MRVITGTARGRVLKAVEGLDVRPTTDKVKEAVFSAVHFQLEGAKMLDLFCGSGQMGIEALSRGAEVCVFVDKDRRSIEVTKQNLVSAGLFQKARVTQTDFKSYLTGCKDSFDIAFLDPPYSCGILQQALPLLVGKMNPSGVILCEHEEKDILPDKVSSPDGTVVFCRTKKYRYARISVSAYRLDDSTGTEN